MSSHYSRRIHLAQNYLSQHFEDEIVLADVAKAAHLSPYHFHRVFTACTQETPIDFLRRIRVEHAAQLLLVQPPIRLIDIAVRCGFKSQALLARAFRAHFGMTASAWRRGAFWQHDGHYWRWKAEGRQQNSKHCKNSQRAQPVLSTLFQMRTAEFVAVRQGRQPSYVRALRIEHKAPIQRIFLWQQGIGREQMLALWQVLLRWGIAQGWLQAVIDTPGALGLTPTAPVLLGISRTVDNPNITEPTRCRYEAGFVLPPGLSLSVAQCRCGDNELLRDELPGGPCVVIDFVGRLADEPLMVEYFYNVWLPQSDWVLADRPAYLEVPLSNAGQVLHPDMLLETRWCIPVRKRRGRANE